MNQVPNYPMANRLPAYQQPQVNAVKIDIINPQAYGGAQQPQAPMMQQPYYYNYPPAPSYNAPMNYYVPQAPQAMPQAQVPVMPQQPAAPQIQQQAPVMDQPQVVQQQATPPSVVEQAPAQPVPPVPVAQVQEAKPAAPAAPVVPQAAPQQAPAVDVNALNTALASANPDQQLDAIQKIAEVGQADPVAAAALLNEQTFQALTAVVANNSAALAGPTPKQTQLRQQLIEGKQLTPQEKAEAETLSPQEKAEMNKQFGTYTLAVLQKNFRQAIDAEAQKLGIPSVSMNELPGIVGIVNNLKDNPNPIIREASISALRYLAAPQDKQTLQTIFDVAAKNDADPVVKESAKQALAELATKQV